MPPQEEKMEEEEEKDEEGRRRRIVTENVASSSSDAASRLVYGKNDVLFGAIEREQGDRPFGKVLDAGTGLHSLRWLATLIGPRGMTEFTGVTADVSMQRNVMEEAKELGIADRGTILIGNWFDTEQPLVLRDDDDKRMLYDTILADYLIGAMDGFSPFQQDLMLPKLFEYLKPGGRIYIVGLQPIPDTVEDTTTAANIICRVRQIRDACILLAGHRCYREYPVEWTERQLKSISNCRLLRTARFPILYRYDTIVKQITVARNKLKYFPSKALAQQMENALNDLQTETLQAIQQTSKGRIRLGFDYVVSAEKQTTPLPEPLNTTTTTTTTMETTATATMDTDTVMNGQ